MPVRGKRGKPKAGFPSLPTALGNRAARFPHSHRPDEQWKRWKAKGRLPTFPLHYDSLIEDLRKEAWRRSFAPPGSSFDYKMLTPNHLNCIPPVYKFHLRFILPSIGDSHNQRQKQVKLATTKVHTNCRTIYFANNCTRTIRRLHEVRCDFLQVQLLRYISVSSPTFPMC